MCRKLISLIELLIVVAVVLILVSILQPGLRKVIDMAITNKCMVEIRSWSQMTMLYTDDHSGYFMEEGFNADWSLSWMRQLAPYHGDTRTNLFCPAAQDLAEKGHGNTFEAWDGPAIGHFTNDRGGGDDQGSYGVNLWIMKTENNRTWRNGTEGGEKWQFHRMNNVDDPSNTPIFADCAWYGAEPHPDINTAQGMPSPTRLWNLESPNFSYVMSRLTLDRHQQGINVAFVDGSSKNIYLEYLWSLQWVKSEWIFRDEVVIPWLN